MSVRWTLRRTLAQLRRFRSRLAALVGAVVTVLSVVYDRFPGGLQVAALALVGVLSAAAVLLLEVPPEARPERPAGPRSPKRRVGDAKAGRAARDRWRWVGARLRLGRGAQSVPTLPPGNNLFSGRETELAILRQVHDTARLARAVPQPAGRRRRVRARPASPDPESVRQVGPVVLLLHGMPGVGKSALAEELARRLAGQYPDGQLFVNMGTAGAVRTPNEILKELLLALGWTEPVPEATVDKALIFRSLTAKKQILFIFDAARHADQVRHVLPSDPATAVIVTSRRDLMLSDPMPASSYALDLPDDDDAMSIFRAVSHTHDGNQPECAAEIVYLCGRLPLAIRSAAERVFDDGTDICHVADLLRAPGARLDRLDQPGRSLRGHLETEYERLLPEEQRAFALLSLVSSATFVPWVLRPLMEDLPAAEAEALIDRLTAAKFLEDAGRDEASETARYRFHPLVKLYADEHASRLPEGEGDNARTALDEAYHELVSVVLHEQHPELRVRVLPRWHNGESTLPKRIAAHPEAWVRTEYPNLLRVMALSRAGSDSWRISVWLGGCVAAGVSPDETLDAYAQALRAAEEDRGGLATVDVLLAKATFLIAVERYRDAEECLTEAAELARQVAGANGTAAPRPAWQRPERDRVAEATRKLGEAFLQAACYRQAIEYLERALDLAEADKDEEEQKLLRILIADAYQVDTPEATFDQLQDSELPDATRYRVLLSLAEAARRRGDWCNAEDYLSQALRFVDGDLRRVATVQYRLARLQLDERNRSLAGDPTAPEAKEAAARAVRRAADAAVTFRRMDNPIGLVRAHSLLTRAMLAFGRPTEAEHLARVTESEYLSLLDLGERPEVLLPLAARLRRAEGELRLAAGDLHGARELMMDAATALGENQDWSVLDRVLDTFDHYDRGRDRTPAGAATFTDVDAAQPRQAPPAAAASPFTLSRSATEGLAARLGSAVADRMQNEFRQILVPAEPVAFRGGITARLAEAVAEEAGVPPVWRIPVGRACELTVLVRTGRDAFVVAEGWQPSTGVATVCLPFVVTTGPSAASVDVTLTVDAPFLEVSDPRLATSCKPDGGTVRYRTSLRAGAADQYSLRIALFSSGRLLQAMPIQLVAVEPEAV
ncbi:hypothetical protein GCM10023322_57150 [Rugosimonospora acidiphila]|uniref:AAA+ ATPase domain-containing protein n=1 Tax=Rugosimonospora acidiphila TaxID=556531 RepID=A0ABP9SDM5_9ACTN